MADYELKKLGQQAVDFFEDTRDIINLGKVAHVIVNAVPAWKADNGEMAFFNVTTPTSDRRIYVRLNSAWVAFSQLIGNVGVPTNPGDGEGAIQFNSSNVFGGENRFLWYANTGSILLGNGQVSSNTGTANSISLGATTRTGQTGRSGLWIIPEVGGPHFFGDYSGFNVPPSKFANGPQYPLQVGQQGNNPDYNVTGLDGASVAFNILNTGLVAQLVFDAYPPSSGQPQDFFIVLDPDVPEASIVIQKPNVQNLVSEIPGLVVGVRTNPTGPVFGGATWTVKSAQTISDFRVNQFWAPTFTSQSNSLITNAATVFIDRAPVQAGSMSITNSYALWIGTGDIRVGGNIITGGNTTIIKNGGSFFTTTTIGISSNNTADTTLIRGIVGTTSLVANTLSEGRTIRLQAWGYYNTALVPDTLNMRVKLGGVTVLATGVQTPAGSVSTGGWALNANIVCQTTGGAGTVFAQGDFSHFTAPTTYVNWQMVNSSTTVINTTGANVVEITAQWGGASSASQLFMTQAVGELLN